MAVTPPPPETAQPQARYGNLPCSEQGCPNQTGAPCEYVDRRSRPCQTAWCPEHQYLVASSVFCRRHAGVVAAVLTLPEEEREFPDLDNRAPSLLEYIARRVHPNAVELLQQEGAARPGSTINVDAMHVTMAGTPRVRGWEHRWRLLDHTGPLATVGLRVDEESDSIVQVKVDANVVYTAEPPWIAERGSGSEEGDSARRELFDRDLVSAMAEGLQRRRQVGY
ncbi:MAG TPA: hypothetical protein VNV65_01240 [Candidatus Solibacter sp.]|nr:hypothetical protein [Candidatus Solibacter sp.]